MVAQAEERLQFLVTNWSGMLLNGHVGQQPVLAVSDCNLAAAHSKTL